MTDQVTEALSRTAEAILDRWNIEDEFFRKSVLSSRDCCIRLIHIYENLYCLFGDPAIERAWLMKPNSKWSRNGQTVSPFEHMCCRVTGSFTSQAAGIWQRMHSVLQHLATLNGRS